MELPKRKQNRLTEYDYSNPNAYFITICTKDRNPYFWTNVNTDIQRPEDIPLSEYGSLVCQCICDIPTHYPMISVDHYAVMPNHVHLLLHVQTTQDGRLIEAPTISTVVNQTKGILSKRIGFPVWQKGFYDHVVRGREDFQQIWNYIEGNPYKWSEDELCKR